MPGMIQPERRLTWSADGRLIKAEVQSFFTGEWNTMEGDHSGCVTREQWDLWQSGVLIQIAMPQLSDDEREFLMTGATPEEWAAEFDDDDIETGD